MSSKGSPVKKARRPRAKPAHPSFVDMVAAAIGNLKDRKGSSLAAIKKYIAATYNVDASRNAHLVRAALKKGVASKAILQRTGSGAGGRFRLGAKPKVKKPKKKKAKKAKAKKPKRAKKAKKPKAKKAKAKSKKPKAKKAKAAKKSAAKAKPRKAAKKVRKAKPKARKTKAKRSPKKAAKK